LTIKSIPLPHTYPNRSALILNSSTVLKLPKRRNAFLINRPYSTLDKGDKAAYVAYIMSIGVALFVIILNTLLDYQTSQLATIVMLIGVISAMHLYFNLKKYFLSSLLLTALLNTITLYLSIKLGLVTSYFLYSFVILPSIPLMVRRNKNFLKNSVLFSLITIGFAVFNLTVSTNYGLENITHDRATTKLVSNSILSLVVMLSFILVLVKVTSNYIGALIIGTQNADKEKATKTRVLSNLGHELRTQINSINGITQLILDQKSTEKLSKATLDDYTGILEVCNSQMLVLVNDVLDIHTIESGNFKLVLKPENVGNLLSKVIVPFKNKIEANNVEFQTNIDPQLFSTSAFLDPARLTQVIHNLLSNAVKYTSKGYIKFSARIEQESYKELTILCAVTDTGIGISNTNLSTIFDSFQQVRDEKNPNTGGTGLGLAISKSIVEKMDSQIMVSSKLHHGSTFSFSVTFRKTSLNYENISAPKHIDESLLVNKIILVAEDNAISMLYASKLLQKHNATILKAANGLEAIAIAKQTPHIDLVLLDLEMPEMNGFTAITHLRELHPTLKIIAFTANIPDEQLFNKLKKLQFDGFLAKPYKNGAMLSIISKHLS
jgi:signal transduction histidine kinase/CheY-like chemotaxis protein